MQVQVNRSSSDRGLDQNVFGKTIQNSLFSHFFFKAAPTLKPSGSNYKIKMLVHLSCKRLNLCGHDAMFNKVSTLDK